MKRKQKEANANIRNDIFNKISEHTEDEEWKKIFSDMAVGKFLPGFRSSGRKIIYQRNSTPTGVILSEDPELALKQCQKFIQKKTSGFKTSQEKAENLKKNEEKSEKGWIVIKKINIQRHLLHYYIDNLVKEKHLSPKQEKELRTTVFIASMNKELKERIEFSDGKIQNINNVYWDNSKEKWIFR